MLYANILLSLYFDLEANRKKQNSKAVKKTLSIPEWLNEEAMAKGLNFSQVLQEALVAMDGWERLKEIWDRTGYRKKPMDKS